LFSIDPESGILSFRHRSFGEYLHALSGYKRHRLLPAERAFEPYWINIQFFQTGLLGDCEEHLNGLLSVIPQSEVGLWLKILVMPDYFLAGYQTRYNVVEENLYKLFIDAANLFDQAKHGKTETRLAELSEMHLLWFFQRLVRNCYEYEFFRKAITVTLLKIDQEVLPDQIRHLALFFLPHALQLNSMMEVGSNIWSRPMGSRNSRSQFHWPSRLSKAATIILANFHFSKTTNGN
jgi:hypothetical protein